MICYLYVSNFVDSGYAGFRMFQHSQGYAAVQQISAHYTLLLSLLNLASEGDPVNLPEWRIALVPAFCLF